MKIKFPKKIQIMSLEYRIIQDKTSNAGSFCAKEGTITIGTNCIKEDPGYTFMIICHEVSEAIHAAMCTRYDDHSVEGNYKFFMDHKEFMNHNSIFSNVIQQFIH